MKRRTFLGTAASMGAAYGIAGGSRALYAQASEAGSNESGEDYQLPRCQALPQADHRVSLQVDGVERLCWRYGTDYPRPFFYPVLGPSGASLTRMGHPGAPDHEHHQSLWFAHYKVAGLNFWNNLDSPVVRQKQWLAYEDGDKEAVMAVLLGWYTAEGGDEVLEQELIAAMGPGENGETYIELDTTFRPTAERLTFEETNFGFLAVRVAKSISARFGGGHLTNSEGAIGESNIFGKQARWMDYSGPVPKETGVPPVATTEGITYFDHPSNPGFPSHWHVRDDGWMGASVCMHQAVETTKEEPLRLRYLIHVHPGVLDKGRADEIADAFANRPGYEVVEDASGAAHFRVQRIDGRSAAT